MERDIQPLKSLCTAEQNAAVHGSLSNTAFAGPILPTGEISADRSLEPTVGRWGCEWPRFTDPSYGATGDLNSAGNASLAELIESEQENGPWPIEHPLPLPNWEEDPIEPYKLKSIREYESLACEIEMHLRKVLEEHNYDTIGNLLKFYESFKNSECDNVLEFFHLYNPPITPDHYSCVGLAFELWHRLGISLEKKYPGIGGHICVVSCEEDIDSMSVYTTSYRLDSPMFARHTLEKEHVLMCLKVEFSGRTAVMLCDPGYHVSRVVTVMADGSYPHTGWFIQSQENKILKEYNYQLAPNNHNFVEWTERATRNGNEEIFSGAIFVGRPFLTAVDVTERRNIVYNFKSLLSRDQKGDLIAGIYFKVILNADEFTIFYQNMGKQRIKLKFSDCMKPKVDEDLLKKLAICNEQLNLPENKLLNTIRTAGMILRDSAFLPQLQDIDRCINLLSENN
ncbi:hypothetical protein JTB14_036521 [Gonioctena quinquepunctata]|nr:hypothetical protein JTB14_036521 [Gonioctena quinquepunctata]